MDWKDGAILAGAGLGILIYDSLRSYKALDVQVGDYFLRDIDWSANRATIQVNIIITNPLLVGLTLYSIQGDAYIDGNYAASIDKKYDYYIRGKRVHNIPLIIDCNIWEAVKLLLDIALGNNATANLHFVGQIRLGTDGLVSIPLDFSETLSN